MATFNAEEFLPVLKRLNRNMAPLMTIALPLALVSTIPILVLSFRVQPQTFFLTLAALACFVVTLVVTMLVEVPIVKTLDTASVAVLPVDWERLRDRWESFHLLRVVPAIAGLVLLVVASIF
jgi:uncharacterized membrane protein